MTNYQEPQLDAAPPPPAQASSQVNPFRDLSLSSKNYWAGRTGRERPPAPTFRMVGGKKMLGRYMDPYGCQCHLRAQKNLWEKWYTNLFIGGGLALLFGPETDFLSLLIVIPLYALWYFRVKARHTKQYNLYYSVQDEIIQSGEPQWVPFDKERLQMLDRNPLAVWP